MGVQPRGGLAEIGFVRPCCRNRRAVCVSGRWTRACLEWGDQFVAEQVGIPSLCEAHWASVGDGPSDLDHAFHEFVGLRAAGPEDERLPAWGTLAELVARMKRAAGRWDVRLSPNCDL